MGCLQGIDATQQTRSSYFAEFAAHPKIASLSDTRYTAADGWHAAFGYFFIVDFGKDSTRGMPLACVGTDGLVRTADGAEFDIAAIYHAAGRNIWATVAAVRDHMERRSVSPTVNCSPVRPRSTGMWQPSYTLVRQNAWHRADAALRPNITSALGHHRAMVASAAAKTSACPVAAPTLHRSGADAGQTHWTGVRLQRCMRGHLAPMLLGTDAFSESARYDGTRR